MCPPEEIVGAEGICRRRVVPLLDTTVFFIILAQALHLQSRHLMAFRTLKCPHWQIGVTVLYFGDTHVHHPGRKHQNIIIGRNGGRKIGVRRA
jgi:hypothetical protein